MGIVLTSTTDITLAVITGLKANTAIAAAVSTKVYRKSLPINSAFPCLVVSKVDDIRPLAHSGRYSRARVQVTSYAVTDLAADTLSEQVADALHGTQNTVMNHVGIVGIEDGGTRTDIVLDAGVYLYHRDFLIEYWY